MRFRTVQKCANHFFAKAAKMARRRGLPGDTEIRVSDLGDVYHVYGVNARPHHLVALWELRAKNAKESRT